MEVRTRTRLTSKALAGALFWVLLLCAGALASLRIPAPFRAALARAQTECWRGIMAPSPRHEVQFPAGTPLALGNGVFVMRGHELDRVGEVVELHARDGGLRATLLLDSARGPLQLTAASRAVVRAQGRSFLYALGVLLPPERMEQIRQEWQRFRRVHAGEMRALLEPVLGVVLTDLTALLTDELHAVLLARRPEIDRLLQRYGQEIAQQRLLPLVQQEIWPLVRREGAAPVERIGRELWDRVPLFELAWRAAYDRVLEDRPVLLEERWRSFVQDEALPVLEAHRPELQELAGRILSEVAGAPRVRAELDGIVTHVLADQELRELVRQILRDLFLQRARIRDYLLRLPDDARIAPTLAQVNDRLQTFLDRVGNLLVYHRDGTSINPDLAHLLRTFLLRRDQRYVFLELVAGEPLEPGAVLRGIQEP